MSPEGSAHPSQAVWLVATGWCGTAAIVGAYFGNSFELLHRGLVYQLLNLGGALALVLVCWERRAWQPLALEVIWALIAAAALVQLALPG